VEGVITMADERADQRQEPRTRTDWEAALRGFLIQVEADELLQPPVADGAAVRRLRR
jgi:hypothetical protein